MFKFILSIFLLANFIFQGAMAQKGKLTLKPDPILSKALVQFMDKQTVGGLIETLKWSLSEEDYRFLTKTYQKQAKLMLSADLRGDKVFINGQEVFTVFEDRRVSLKGKLFAYNPSLGVEENLKNLDRVLQGSKTSLLNLLLPQAQALPLIPIALGIIVVGGGGYQMFFSKDEVEKIYQFSHADCQGQDYVLVFQDKKKKSDENRKVMSPAEVSSAFEFENLACDEVSSEMLKRKIVTSSAYTKRLALLQGKNSAPGVETHSKASQGAK